MHKSKEIAAKSAVFVTNDVKPDWVYTLNQVELSNGKFVSGSTPEARKARFPKPEISHETKTAFTTDACE